MQRCLTTAPEPDHGTGIDPESWRGALGHFFAGTCARQPNPENATCVWMAKPSKGHPLGKTQGVHLLAALSATRRSGTGSDASQDGWQ